MPKSLVCLLLLLWAQFFYAVHSWWAPGGYYEFGWIIPLAAAWFFRQRSLELPAAGPARAPDVPNPLVFLAGPLLLACLVFLRFVERSDPFWRIPLWVHVLLVAGVHHAVLARYRYPPGFAWITVLVLTAVPLPGSLERIIVDNFTGLLMRVSEAVANFQGLPVMLRGTALVAGEEVLDITEGCSGIRSLQGLAMFAVFCGEWFRLPALSRLGLMAAAAGFAFLFNAARTVTLTWIFFEHGQESFDASHDRIGSAALACGVLALAGAAWVCGRARANRG